MDPVLIGGVGAGTFVFLVLMLAFLLKFARKGKKETVVNRVPRMANQGKYIELATGEDFHYYGRNQLDRPDLTAKYLHDNKRGIPDSGTYQTKDPISFSSRFMSKNKKRKYEAYNGMGGNRIVNYRNVDKGISTYEPGYQTGWGMESAVDRVITRNLVGKTKLSSNEPHAECIGHNNSPVGRPGVCRTRVFQSPLKSYSNEVNGQFPKLYKLHLSNDHRFPKNVYGKHAVRYALDSRPRDRRHVNVEQKILTQVQCKKRSDSAEPYENNKMVFIKPHETRQAKRDRPRDTSQRMSSRIHDINHSISGISYHDSQQTMSQQFSSSRHDDSEWPHERKRCLGKRSVKDIVEEVKRESQLCRKFQVRTDDRFDSVRNMTPETYGRKEIPTSETPSITWKSRKLLKPENIDENVLVKQEEQYPSSVYDTETDTIMVNSFPPLDPAKLPSQSPEVEFPPLPSFIMSSDATSSMLTNNIVSSQVVLPRYLQTDRKGEISQYAKLASPVQLTSPVKQVIRRPSLKVPSTYVGNGNGPKQVVREAINGRSHSITKSNQLLSLQSLYPLSNRTEVLRYMKQEPNTQQVTSTVFVNGRTCSQYEKVNGRKTVSSFKSQKLKSSAKDERTHSQMPNAKGLNDTNLEHPRKRKLFETADHITTRSPSPDTEITDYVKELLQSISNEAVQQQVIGSQPHSSKPTESATICPSQKKKVNRIDQVASICSNVELTFSPQETSTPIQSSTDVQEQVRTDQSVIQSALRKRRLRIANSSATSGGESSTTVIPDVSNTLHDVLTSSGITKKVENVHMIARDPDVGSLLHAMKTKRFSSAYPEILPQVSDANGIQEAPESKSVHKTYISNVHTDRSPAVHSAPSSPTWHTKPKVEKKKYQLSFSAPSSPTFHGKNNVSLPYQTQTETNDTDIHTGSATNHAVQTETSALLKMSPRELLLQEIRSRRRPDED